MWLNIAALESLGEGGEEGPLPSSCRCWTKGTGSSLDEAKASLGIGMIGVEETCSACPIGA